MQIFGNFGFGAVQKRAYLVKSFPTSIYLQNLASIQPKTSPQKFLISFPSRQFNFISVSHTNFDISSRVGGGMAASGYLVFISSWRAPCLTISSMSAEQVVGMAETHFVGGGIDRTATARKRLHRMTYQISQRISDFGIHEQTDLVELCTIHSPSRNVQFND